MFPMHKSEVLLVLYYAQEMSMCFKWYIVFKLQSALRELFVVNPILKLGK